MKHIELPESAAVGLTLLRVAVGLVFVMHGGQKLFVWGIPGVTAAFTGMGIPLPALSAVVVTLVEFLGGLAYLAGFLTRWTAVPMAINMVVAMLAVHLKGGFFLPAGLEYTLTLLGAHLTLALSGGGALSVDGVLAQRKRS
jgi:putative oxidoreductase